MKRFLISLLTALALPIAVNAEENLQESSELNSIIWEKIDENNKEPLKKIIWKSYNDDKSYFENKNLKSYSNKNLIQAQKNPTTWRNRILRFSFEEIDMPDAGEYMGLYSIGAYDRLNPWLYGGITAYGAQLEDVAGFLLVDIPWVLNISLLITGFSMLEAMWVQGAEVLLRKEED